MSALFLLFISLTSHAEIRMHGAGSTFVYPLFSKWFSVYGRDHGDTLINYQSIGSGGGIRQLIDGTVDFGATDIPMNEEQLKKAKRPVHHFPITSGAVVVTYSVDEIQGELKLDSNVLGGIFLGKIVKWNDSEIKKLNPTLTLPDRYITVVHRSDGSGTSAVFTEFLSKTNAEWKERVGSGTSLQWPVGLGGKGNEGVTGLVKSLKDTIAYVELTFALSQKLPIATIQNSSGAWIRPSLASVTAAADSFAKNIPEDFRFTITGATGQGSYPISSLTFFLLDERLSVEKWNESIRLLKWMLGPAQEYSEDLHYAKISKILKDKMTARLQKLEAMKR